MHTGKIAKWIDERGFGFIEPDGGGENVFTHVSQIRNGVRPERGSAVTYEIGSNERTGKPEAQRVSIVASPDSAV